LGKNIKIKNAKTAFARLAIFAVLEEVEVYRQAPWRRHTIQEHTKTCALGRSYGQRIIWHVAGGQH
jgi:hypothetical protein